VLGTKRHKHRRVGKREIHNKQTTQQTTQHNKWSLGMIEKKRDERNYCLGRTGPPDKTSEEVCPLY